MNPQGERRSEGDQSNLITLIPQGVAECGELSYIDSMRYRLFFPPLNRIHGVHNLLDYWAKQRPADMGTYELVYEDDIHPPQAVTINDTLDAIWSRHNEDGRPRGREIRSMSIGDVVELLGQYWVVEREGWSELKGVEIPALDRSTFPRPETVNG